MAEPARAEIRYTAFLSYSHRDAAAAARLHRRLESYRVPNRLVGTESPRGPVPRRLWPIFRDREELPAASDLSETVRTALAQSGALIILCSPHAAGSLWVAEEIETFRTLHPDRPILAAILDGDPPDCFPQALRAFGQDGTWHEPLATDLQPKADGKHLGLLKLVAGITGLGLDDLVQRDASRRVRRVTAVTAAALIAMLVMAVLAVVALQARREADRQRAEAEGLIEFMHTDLREQLRGVGRLDIMDAVNQRALAFYARQEVENSTPDGLAMRARVIHTIGEDNLARGNTNVAISRFREAYEVTALLFAQYPNDPEIIFAHGQSEYWMGYLDQLQRRWPQAGQRYARYAALAHRLIDIAPDNPDYMLEMAWGASNLGVYQRDGLGNPVAAQAFFETAVHWFEGALRARPRTRDARDLANAYGDLADSFYVRLMWRESLGARFHAYRIYQRLRRSDPTNAEFAYRVAIAGRSIARLFDRLGDPASERPYLLDAYEGSRRLTTRDPNNAEWLLLKTKIECDLLAANPAVRAGIPAEGTARSIRAAASALEAQGNPRVSEIRICLGRLRPATIRH